MLKFSLRYLTKVIVNLVTESRSEPGNTWIHPLSTNFLWAVNHAEDKMMPDLHKDEIALHHLRESVFKLVFKIHIPRKPFRDINLTYT